VTPYQSDASVAVLAAVPQLREKAALIARQLALPIAAERGESRFGYLLVVSPERLELHRQGASAPGPLHVDFTGGTLAYRRRSGGGRRQALARAVGMKSGYCPDVLDATAGLGRDGFILACLGCRVRLVERSPIIGALLRDGVERAALDKDIGAVVQTRLSLEIADSREWMAHLADGEHPDVVCVDPMYPPRTKTALVKKDMQVLQHLLGADSDADELLRAALRCARRRVVVKRPRSAPPLQGPSPGLQITGQSTRFDVYLLNTGRC
jgi:16S rRNA (guanine1516-N2)-methyltransferase